MARDLGMAGVIVPLYPGVFSALGLLMSDVKHDYIRSRMTPISELTPDDVNAVFAQLETQARDDLRRDGFADREIRIERALDMRYAGQGYEITMACTAEQTTALDALRKTFDAEHQSQFGHMAPEEPVEVVSYRVRGVGIVPAGDHAEIQADRAVALRCVARDAASALRRHRRFRARSISAKSSMSG